MGCGWCSDRSGSLKGSGVKFRIVNASVEEANRKILDSGTKAEVYEFEAEMRPGQAEDMDFRLRKGKDAETLVGFDALRSEVYVDRTRSGEVSFAKDFPGRHRCQDRGTGASSAVFVLSLQCAEVFANDGERVLRASIPPPASDGIELYAHAADRKSSH